MATEDHGLDRLMARHSLPLTLSIRWKAKPRRRLRRGAASASVGAMILDLSLTGALIEVLDPADTAVGDLVEIKLGERTGLVKVRHMNAGERSGSVLFGVEFVETDELQDQIEVIVERLRGNGEQIRKAWQQAT